MESMFYYCNLLTSLNISSFNTSNVINMSEMFKYCSSLTSIDLSSFNTSKVTAFVQMFQYCSLLTNVTGIGSLSIVELIYANFMFESVTLNNSNYNSLLTGWEAQIEKSNVPFHGGNSKYSAGAPATARANLQANGWVIQDGGLL
jgi:surface protein